MLLPAPRRLPHTTLSILLSSSFSKAHRPLLANSPSGFLALSSQQLYSAVCNHVWVWDERNDICFCYEMVLRRDSVSDLLMSQHSAEDMMGLQKELVELRDEEKYQVFRAHHQLRGQTAFAVCLRCLLCFGEGCS